MTFRNRVALITGGSSGIGLATAKLLAASGARVWLLARTREHLESAADEIRRIGGPNAVCGVLPADVSDPGQTSAAIERVAGETGVPDIVVNSAGTVLPGYFQELGPEVFRDAMDVNYFGTLFVCQAVVPGMITRKSGHIINIASTAAFMPVFGYSAYAASKHAVRGLSEVLRVELKPHGITVSVVYPPDTDTPQLAREDAYKPAETRAFNGGVVLSPDHVASSIMGGMARRQFVITPGIESTLVRRLTELLGDLQYPIFDLIVSRAQRGKP